MICAQKVILVFEDVTMIPIVPKYLGITEEKMVEYMRENPMPKDEEYSGEDFINDITESGGFYSLPDGIKKKTIDYIVDMLNNLAY